MTHFVVIGAGQAGASLVAKLRAEGFEGDITLIGEEPVPPYQRPPLSKGYLLGEMAEERLYLRPAEFYGDQRITLRLGHPVTAVDAVAQTVTVGGDVLGYDQLAFTTGSRPRRLPDSMGGALDGVHVVRTLADVDQMADAFRAGARVLVVGGGYIGLEAAAVASKTGMQVTLIEMAPRILQRVASPQTSDHFRALHQAHGVRIMEGTVLQRLVGDHAVTAAVLGDGTELSVDLVIVGIGIEPCTGLAQQAGVVCENGIRVDAFGRTSDPQIWAAGDCASFPYRGQRIRLESVQNAIDQAEIVARNMLGADVAYDPHPWFWSDQYDAKLQIAGLNTGYDRVVTRGQGDAVSFWYYAGDQLLSVDAVNDPRAYMVGKRLIEGGKSPDADAIAAPDIDLKALLRA
ncbi:NAD(P)/FAD-dependent oxidoreductase [Pseudaestuariivita rosea]|uniref:NAD(P)/FAD-dependent oxidoreductase n=1 Tax=Pseudaestuariivita rosea TaxID=2763263 RepID=UPI001ABB8889|nr:FAD-dependent oxidoreductase [Pseudaestuariivita rosea]